MPFVKGGPRPVKGRGKGYLWLLAHVDYQGDECLPWPFSVDRRVGRGMVGYNGATYWAHRFMCELAHGKPPTPKHQAAHECGKGHYGCVNPRHLKWKTNSENQLDRRRNGNMLRNRNGPRPTLTEAQIDEILSLKGKMTQVAIAKKFGVSLGCVQYWLKYRTIRSMPEAPKYLAAILEWRNAHAIAERLGRHVSPVRAQLFRLVERGWAEKRKAIGGPEWRITDAGLEHIKLAQAA
jgi:transposase